MSTLQLLKRSLVYYWRTNLAVVLGVTVAIAVLAGALLVGDSVRASLRNLVVKRLGNTSFIVTSSSFFRDRLAEDIESDQQFKANGFGSVCPLIQLQGTITHESSKRVASAINVYGVDDRFWTFNRASNNAPQNRSVFVSETLAGELGTHEGDSIVLRVQRPTDIPLESLHSKKDQIGETLRLTVGANLASDSIGDFSLQPQQTGVRAIFVSLKVIQEEIEQIDKVNLLLISDSSEESAERKTNALNKILRERVNLKDLGVESRQLTSDGRQLLSIEHDSKMISDPLATTINAAAKSSNLRELEYFSYLANNIGSGERSIPYSLVTAVGTEDFQQLRSKSPQVDSKSSLPPIVLNQWAATDLGVKQGDQITLEYYLWQTAGGLETKSSTFELAGIVPIEGLAADRNLVPDYPGISGSENLSDWDPPFPIDLERIRQQDEDYWKQYRTTPKAFIPLDVGQNLWGSRFGKRTSIRIVGEGAALLSFPEKLKQEISPVVAGLVVVPVRSQSVEASRGATDFGEYFLYFSFFLVVSALLLTTLFFKLGIEQRIREIGTLRALGYGPSTIRKLYLSEGLLLSVVGTILGLLGAIGYGQLMMFGLRTWWVDAVGTTSLQLHVAPRSLLIGAAAGIVATMVCVLLTLRGLRKRSTRSLLSGAISDSSFKTSAGRTAFWLAIVLSLLGVVLLVAAAIQLIGQVAGFFGGGTLLLAAFLFYQSSWLKRPGKKQLTGAGWWAVARLGFRNATYRPARSILCISLIAAASFIIVAVDSFRHRGEPATTDLKSGTGGFPLMAESLLPIVSDPNSREGQQELNISSDDSASPLSGIRLTRFRLQPGDDASCLNLYQPQNPKIVAPPDDFLGSGRFTFQNSLQGTAEETANPWLLLNREFSDGAIPVIADANSLTYVLHLKLGEDFLLDNAGQPIKLRVVAALSGSLFQSELLMSEKNFVRLFPDQQGYRFFLIDVPNVDRSAAVATSLEDRLADFGFDVQPTAERLASFHRVENTYLSTFQMLGGLGLILGTIGLAAVLLRNVLERRRELALMRAIGYNAQHFTVMILAENVFLLFSGVLTGAFCALLAISPVLLSRQGQFFNSSIGLLLLVVLVSGLLASFAATLATIRTPLLPALRAE